MTTFCGFSSFTIVVTDVDGETAADGGGISSLLPECARSSMVEKLLKVDLSRFEDGDILWSQISQISKSAELVLCSPQHTGFVVVVRWRPFRPCMEQERRAQLCCRFSDVVFRLPLCFFDVALRHWVPNCPVDPHAAFDTSY